jgi:hypothetical protein
MIWIQWLTTGKNERSLAKSRQKSGSACAIAKTSEL